MVCFNSKLALEGPISTTGRSASSSAAIFGLVALEGVDLGCRLPKVAMIQRGSMIDGYAIGVDLKILKI